MPPEPSNLDFGQLSASGQLAIDSICDRFESQWQAGTLPRIRDFLAAAPNPSSAATLFRELLRIEVQRRQTSGDEPQLGEYLAEFAEYEAIVRAEFAHDARDVLASQDSTIVAPADPATAHDSAQLAPSAPSVSSTSPLASRYQLGVEIARGGMGVVHRATDLQFRREVAIKLLRPHWEKQLDPVVKRHQLAQAVEAFRYEAEITARLQHPGIPPVHELGLFADDLPFLAMKLIQGRTLQQLLDARQSPLDDLPRWLQVFEQVAQAVGYAHSQGILHRDLKPLNVMVGEFGEVQVMDWGLAKILGGSSARVSLIPTSNAATPATSEPPPEAIDERHYQSQRGDVKGTWQYMPPEQALGEIKQLTPRADVFGLGAILCQILTGSPPYTGLTGYDLQRSASAGDLANATERLQKCSVDRDLIDLAVQCLAPNAADRPATGTAVASAIAAHRANVEQRLRQAELDRVVSAQRQVEQAKRRWLWYGVIGLLLGLFMCVAGVSLYIAFREFENSRLTQRIEEDALALANNLANHESAAGNHKVALELYQRSLGLRLKRFGKNHRKTLDAMINLGKEYHKIGQHEKALAIELELLPIAKEIRGPFDRFTLNTIFNIGNGYYETKRYAEAIPYYEEALKLRKEHLGERDPDTGMSYNNLANAYFDVGRFEEARALFTQAHKLSLQQRGQYDSRTIRILWSLANTEEKLQNWPTAEGHYLASYRATEKLTDAKDRRKTQLELLPDIIKFYEAWKNPSEVEKWQMELVKQTLKKQ